jgi:hypothetical protein
VSQGLCGRKGFGDSALSARRQSGITFHLAALWYKVYDHVANTGCTSDLWVLVERSDTLLAEMVPAMVWMPMNMYGSSDSASRATMTVCAVHSLNAMM